MRFVMVFCFCLSSCIACLGIARTPQAAPAVVQAYRDWAVFRDSAGDEPVCFVASSPKQSAAMNTARDATYLAVSIRPATSPGGVVYLETGYESQPNSRVQIIIDDRHSFFLFTRNRDGDARGGAWAYDDEQDESLIAAMKAGRILVARGISSGDALSTDAYSLLGFTQAYAAARRACGV
jgi:hypothetical protein